jgi:hypothetical protein
MKELTTHEVQNISGGKSGVKVEDLPFFGAPVTAESVHQPLLDGQPKADLA